MFISVVANFYFADGRADGRPMYGRTPCVKIMTTYLAAGAWWVKNVPFDNSFFFTMAKQENSTKEKIYIWGV